MRRRPDPTITAPSVFRRRDALAEAFAVLAQRPVRTLLTALGTILGVAAFVTTTGLAETASAQVSSRFDALRATEVRVQDAAPDGTNPFPDDTDQRLQALNGVNHAGVSYTVADPGTIQPRTLASRPLRTTTPIPVIAASPGALRAARPTLATGRLYDDWHQERAEHVAVIGRVAADQLGITSVDRQPVVFLDDTPYVVAGIIDDVARNPDLLLAITIPTTTADTQFDTANAERQVLIDTAPGAAQLIGTQAPLALRPQQPERLQALVPPGPPPRRAPAGPARRAAAPRRPAPRLARRRPAAPVAGTRRSARRGARARRRPAGREAAAARRATNPCCRRRRAPRSSAAHA